MMYGYMTLGDDTEVVHSGIELKNGIETVRVYFERPTNDGGFDTAECTLPEYAWRNVRGF